MSRTRSINGRVVCLTAAALLLGAVIGGCGGDDGAEVRDVGTTAAGSGSASGSGSGSGSGSASGSGSGSGSGTGTAASTCKPVGTELEAQAIQTVTIDMKDYEFAPNVISVPAGIVTFEVTNSGTEEHELAFLPGGGAVPMSPEGVPDEAALEAAGAFELEAFPPGETCKATFDLSPGEYTLFCIVEASDGHTHYEKGMEGRLTVT